MTVNNLSACLILSVAPCGVAAAQVQSVTDSPHNLSVSSAGGVRAVAEEQVCIFCHAPHHTAAIRPLWNRYLSTDIYAVYTSSALDALPGQPTGASKMCLSCHDGTIALGSVVSRDQVIQMANGITTLPPGTANLGTDLSDDHPISFEYDALLAGQDGRLVDPSQLPPELPLDASHELQCTTCHDPHNNVHGDFLSMSNMGSAMCRSCHTLLTTTISGHQDCTECHSPHSAPSGPFLLAEHNVRSTCTSCHDGSVSGAADILADLEKFSVHDTDSPVDPPDPIPAHATCANCHDPHTMTPGSGAAPAVHPNFGAIDGVNSSGSAVATANFEYEVCFKCHADDNASSAPWVPRLITQINTRLEFDLSSVSFHPVEGPGRNPDVPSLLPPWTTASIVYCSDCHGSDNGLGGPNGVHGSNFGPVLRARYETADHTPESAGAYALCYTCHRRSGGGGILDDASFDEHDEHIRSERTPCSACHDAHGISSAQGNFANNSHLINFDLSIVQPDPNTGRLEFEDTGVLTGRCFLRCHNENHSPKSY